MGTMGTWGKGKAISPWLPSEGPMTCLCQRGRDGGGWGSAAEGEAVITWACTARWKAPRLKGSMEPLWFLVPSGKTQTRTWGRKKVKEDTHV